MLYFKNVVLIYFWLCWVFLAVWGLSLVGSKHGLLSIAVPELLVAVASLAESLGFRCIVVAPGLSSCGA